MTAIQTRREIPFGKPMLGDAEKAAVLAVLDSGQLVHGSRIEEFEASFAAFARAPYAVGVSSCTAAMHLVYTHFGLGPGDEVVVPAMTHTATAHAVELTGARAVFVDAEPQTGNIDLDRVESAITERTRALAVVHYLGMPVDMDRVKEIAGRHHLLVVEDCALALGSTFRDVHVGLHGDAGCFSFYPVKHMTTAEGGAIITRDEDLAGALRLKRAFGVDRTHQQRSVPGLYDVVELGFNYRMSEVHAAIGVEQLERLPEFLRRRRINYDSLTRNLRNIKGIRLLKTTQGPCASSYYCQAVLLDDSLAGRRPQVIEKLRSRGIGTSIYYPHPVPAMSYYHQKYGYKEAAFPVAASLANDSIALPVGPHLNEDDMDYISFNLDEILQEDRR